MKRILLLTLAALVSLTACEEKKLDEETVELSEAYNGTFEIQNSDGTMHQTEAVLATLEVDGVTGTGTLSFTGISFSPKMPMKIDMSVPGVTCTASQKGYTLSGEAIIPIAMGGPYTRYIVDGLSGTVTPAAMNLQLTIGGLPASYSGSATK